MSGKQQTLKRPGLGRPLIIVGSLLVVFVCLFPFWWMVLSSIKTLRELYTVPPIWWPEAPTLDNYRKVLFESNIPRYFLNSVVISVGATGAGAGAGDLRLLRLRPLRLPGQAAAAVLRADRPAAADGGDHRAAVHHAARARPGQHLLGPDPRLHDHHPAALGLDADQLLQGDPGRARGGGDHRRRHRGSACLFRITLPLSLPGIVAVLVYAFVTTWNEFIFALCFATDSSVKTLPIGLAEFSTEFNTDWGAVMAASVVMTLPIALLFLSMQRLFVGGLTAGATKG